MTGNRFRVLLAAAALAVVVGLPPAAHAAPQPWNGTYQMVTYASQKAGTSAASRQREDDFGATFTLATQCSVRDCVATVVDGCVGCGLCGANAHAATLCPSFYRAEVVCNPSWHERLLAGVRASLTAWLRPA